MLPRNFPGRKNDRRIKALDRLKNTLNKPTLIAPDSKEEHEKKVTRMQAEIKKLETKIMEPLIARGVRTKKTRKVNT